MATKYKKRSDGRYMAQVTIGILDDGKPKKKTVYAKTIKEIDEKVADLKKNYKQGTLIENESVTVAEWAEEWAKTYKVGKEYKTQEMYNSTLKNHIVPELGHYKLKDLKTHHIQSLINDRYSKGKTRLLEIIYLTINQMLKQALINDMIYKNVALGVELPSLAKPKKRALTDNEKELIKNCPVDLKTKTFTMLLMHTGLRKGEALALTKKDINLVEGFISVNKDIVIKSNKSEIKEVPKSEAGNRNVPIPDELKQLLIEYIPKVEGIYVFPSANNVLMSHSAFRRFWDKFTRELNFYAGGNDNFKIISDDITPHIFRHTYATMLYYAAVDMKTAQRLLGHSSLQMTMEVYTHLQENNAEVVNKINDFLGQSKVK